MKLGRKQKAGRHMSNVFGEQNENQIIESLWETTHMGFLNYGRGKTNCIKIYWDGQEDKFNVLDCFVRIAVQRSEKSGNILNWYIMWIRNDWELFENLNKKYLQKRLG